MGTLGERREGLGSVEMDFVELPRVVRFEHGGRGGVGGEIAVGVKRVGEVVEGARKRVVR